MESATRISPNSQKQRRPSSWTTSWAAFHAANLVILLLISTIDHVIAFQSSHLQLPRGLVEKQYALLHNNNRERTALRSKKRNYNDIEKDPSFVRTSLFGFFAGLQIQDLSRHALAATLALTISIVTVTSPSTPIANAMDDYHGMGTTSSSSSTTTSTTPTTSAAAVTSSAPEETDFAIRAGMSAKRYWSIMANNLDLGEDAQDLKIRANEALLDHAVGTINTMYYDNSGGAYFTPREFYNKWRDYRDQARLGGKTNPLATRQGAVDGLRYLVSTLNDPYSKYLTREEMWHELHTRNDGFLGVGALVEPPDRGDQFFQRHSAPTLAMVIPDNNDNNHKKPFFLKSLTTMMHSNSHPTNNHKLDHSSQQQQQLTAMRVQNLPVVTAVVPDSPAERSGVTVGDRIVAVGEYSFLGQSRADVSRNFNTRFATGENYFGNAEVTLAKPVFRSLVEDSTTLSMSSSSSGSGGGSSSTMTASSSSSAAATRPEREVVIGYRQTRVRLPAKSLEDEFATTASTSTDNPAPQVQQKKQQQPQQKRIPLPPQTQYALASANTMAATTTTTATRLPEALTKAPQPPATKGGNAIVHWEVISEQSTPSIFQRSVSTNSYASSSGTSQSPSSQQVSSSTSNKSNKVGYIRLTRFSRASTAGYIEAIQSLEQAGATSFIIDVRNNYGGIIQEAMLTASTLIRDPHAVLCYTLNARGGFTPHDVEEYVVDKRYPGYLLSREPKWVTLHQVQQEAPDMFEENGNNWVPPSSFASLHEQTTKRGIHRVSSSSYNFGDGNGAATSPMQQQWNTAAGSRLLNYNRNQQWLAQKPFVVLINEGTASAAEVFASSLHDNGRVLALIGSKSYGKGLIQHTFPMPDGGGLRLTVAEYLTPALHHVTNVGNARFDPVTGEQVGGGIRPDLSCDSRQGIPSNIGADLCVGMALDVLDEAVSGDDTPQQVAPSHDWTTPQKGLFVKDGSGGGSSTLSASK